ncbi:MAG: 4Fe-4S binding protein [Prevotella sp.]|nr:4Fe-4S binding protein [Prevotella sp.]
MLRKTRTALGALFFVGITLLFLDFTGTLYHWLGWMAKVQFLPAAMALNVVVVILLIVLTLIFGRIYCSVICPLGIMQDIIARIGRTGKRLPYKYSKAKNWLRYTVLGLFIMAFIAGIGSIVALLAPYSSYGRIASNLIQPVYLWGNNLLAAIAEHYDSYAFYSVDVWIRSLPTFVIAVVTLLIIGMLAWNNGRTYCNTICPVGTILGFLSRFSLLKVYIDTDKCRNCSKCSRHCKAACIDFKAHKIDYSRCVACGNCLGTCEWGALKYGRIPCIQHQKENPHTPEPIDKSKRNFLLAATTAATASAFSQATKKVDGGLAEIEDKLIPERVTPITPPGSLSAKNMAQHCTGCQLCVAECPNEVLRPSTSMFKLMQPMLSYERGYCRPECTRCSEVCPAGAIRPITREEKTAIQVGHAVWIRENCLAIDGIECGNCERHCPAGAIEMVPIELEDEEEVFVPAVDESRCIGCGACENLCPARPFSAIYVEGHEVHREV